MTRSFRENDRSRSGIVRVGWPEAFREMAPVEIGRGLGAESFASGLPAVFTLYLRQFPP